MPSCQKFKVGFLVNPIAGMGGTVGLKGTDGLASEARLKGAKPLAGLRANACLQLLAREANDLIFFTASGEMGECLLKESGIEHFVVHTASEETSSEDTNAACKRFLEEEVDLILFCGGDGTARDVVSAAGQMPIIGIPAGVKMYSGVFAISPEAAAELALGFAHKDFLARETEVVDVDEELYRLGELHTRLYAKARTPYKSVLVQEQKRIYSSSNEDQFKNQIALFASEFMRDGSAYILGAGTTTSKIAELLGIDKTLLGVDVIQNGKLTVKDASEKELLELLDKEEHVKIIVSPIGAQGFIFGRGSQQISASVLRRTGIENLIIVSTPHKLAELPYLLIDTGDPKLDREVQGKRMVVTGYRIAQQKDSKDASQIWNRS